MKEKMLVGAVAALAAVLGGWLFHTLFVSASAPDTGTSDSAAPSVPAKRRAAPDGWRGMEVGAGVPDASLTGGVAERVDNPSASVRAPFSEWVVDLSRLGDPAYETDVDLVRLANGYGLTASCLLAQVRLRTAGSPVRDACDAARWVARHDGLHVLPGTYEDVCRLRGAQVVCRPEKVAAHPFEQFENHELESLALSSPEAAVVLARRLPDPAAAERYYEQAVALSGRPGPLLEWMTRTGTGGLEFYGDQLDVGKAMLGYEIYLVMTAFEHGRQAADDYAGMLAGAGVDLEPIRQRAGERLERLRRLRLSLLGSDWEE